MDRAFSGTRPFLLLFLLYYHVYAAEDVGSDDLFAFLRVPAVRFGARGEYFGQTATREADGRRVPHGVGSYLDAETGRVEYAGRWFNGQMHGRGNRYFASGANYSGELQHGQLHGRGKMEWPNGTVFAGGFVHNRRSGRGVMQYPNGDLRRGKLVDDVWTGEAVFEERGFGPDEELRRWDEEWENGTYDTAVKIFKKVDNDYTNIRVRVVCKAHGPPPVSARLFRGERELSPDDGDGEKVRVTATASGEVFTLAAEIPFSDESFAVYTCVAGEQRRQLQVRNPFFIESHGECGFRPGDVEGNGRFAPPPLPRREFPEASSSPSVIGDYCGATLISPWHVLTAAHCLRMRGGTGGFGGVGNGVAFAPDQLTVKLGYTTRPKSLNGEDYGVDKVFVHPSYSASTLTNDIALLVLSRKARIGKYVNPVCLPRSNNHMQLEDAETSTELVISGFGLTYNASDITRGWFYPTTLQVSTVKVLPLSSCFSRRRELASTFAGHFCAGAGFDHAAEDAFREDSCNGDSGGPATYQDRVSGRHYLAGLVSSGHAVCGSRPGSVYVNVTHYLDWIYQVRMADLLQEYGKTGAVPYDRIDSPIFRAMLDQLARTPTDVWAGGN